MSNLIPLAIEWFPKDSNYLMGNEVICVDIDLVRQILKIDMNYDPNITYDYNVSEKTADILQKYYKHKINLEQYEYFVCSYGNHTCP